MKDMGISAYILAGGKSLRFGSDKARALRHGQPLISRTAKVLKTLCSDLFVVADQEAKYADLGFVTLADHYPGCGPIGGLETALRHAGHARWILVISCDWAILPVEFLQPLLSADRKGCRAIAYYDVRWQPLPGLYHTACLPVVEAQIHRRQFALWNLLESISAPRLTMPSLMPQAVQINTREELSHLP